MQAIMKLAGLVKGKTIANRFPQRMPNETMTRIFACTFEKRDGTIIYPKESLLMSTEILTYEGAKEY